MPPILSLATLQELEDSWGWSRPAAPETWRWRNLLLNRIGHYSFPVAQLVEHGASNAKIMGSIPRESKS